MARIAWIVVLAACGAFRAYDGDARPRDEVARLRVSGAKIRGTGVDTKDEAFFAGFGRTYAARVIRVDDRPVHRRSTVDVLPGLREIEIEWTMQGPGVSIPIHDPRRVTPVRRVREWGRAVLTVDARAGREYGLVWQEAHYARIGPEGREEWIRTGDAPVVRFQEE